MAEEEAAEISLKFFWRHFGCTNFENSLNVILSNRNIMHPNNFHYFENCKNLLYNFLGLLGKRATKKGERAIKRATLKNYFLTTENKK